MELDDLNGSHFSSPRKLPGLQSEEASREPSLGFPSPPRVVGLGYGEEDAIARFFAPPRRQRGHE